MVYSRNRVSLLHTCFFTRCFILP